MKSEVMPAPGAEVRVRLMDDVIEVVRGGRETVLIAQAHIRRIEMLRESLGIPEAVDAPETSALIRRE